MKWLKWCCISVLAVVGLWACGGGQSYQTQAYVFGTLVDIQIVGESEARAKQLANHILADFQLLHRQLHAWEPNSDLMRINQAFAQGKTQTINPEMAHLLQELTGLSVRSDELFNPSIGQLLHAWGFQRDTMQPMKVLPQAAIEHHMAMKPSLRDLLIQDLRVSSHNPTLQLDLGGYAKGYALDRAASYLRKEGVKHALINLGGNIIALGKHGKHPWRVGIQNPRASTPLATLDLPDGWAIGTSGDYQRYFMMNGQRYSHLLDPRTGMPAQHTQAVTVLAPPLSDNAAHVVHAGVLSDVASKPLFIADLAHKAYYAHRLGITNFLIVTAEGKVLVSSEMSKRLHWYDTHTAFSIIQGN